MASTDRLRKHLQSEPTKKPIFKGGLSTGSTLVNLAMTGKITHGISKGSYYLLVGDSESGKTWCALNCLAEASINPNFKDYKLIYDSPEQGDRMDKERFFGKKLVARLEEECSSTVEDYYYRLDDLNKEETPYIHVLDSMDALVPRDELKKNQKEKTAYRKGKEDTGSYGTAKAKQNSSKLRIATNSIAKSGSILIVIAQTRDNIGFGSQFKPKTRSGGTALKFFATAELWFSVRETLKRRVNQKNRQIGTVLKVKVEKNRETGFKPIVDLHHYPSTGLDDISSNVAFLLDEGHWRAKKAAKEGAKVDFLNQVIDAPEFKFSGRAEELIEKIDQDNTSKELQDVVLGVWKGLMTACAVKRRPRYS